METGTDITTVGQNQLIHVSKTKVPLVPDSTRKIPPGLLYQSIAVGIAPTIKAINNPKLKPDASILAVIFILTSYVKNTPEDPTNHLLFLAIHLSKHNLSGGLNFIR